MLESKNLTVQTEGELCYITIPAFEKTGLVRHCFCLLYTSRCV